MHLNGNGEKRPSTNQITISLVKACNFPLFFRFMDLIKRSDKDSGIIQTEAIKGFRSFQQYVTNPGHVFEMDIFFSSKVKRLIFEGRIIISLYPLYLMLVS